MKKNFKNRLDSSEGFNITKALLDASSTLEVLIKTLCVDNGGNKCLLVPGVNTTKEYLDDVLHSLQKNELIGLDVVATAWKRKPAYEVSVDCTMAYERKVNAFKTAITFADAQEAARKAAKHPGGGSTPSAVVGITTPPKEDRVRDIF